MFTLREAHNRCAHYNMGFRVYGSLQAQIFFREDRNDKYSVLIDYDLDDVVLTASRMRKERDEEQSGDSLLRRA